MEQNMRFGLILGQLAILKKNGADYEQLLRPFFHVFVGKNNVDFKKKKHCSVSTKKFHMGISFMIFGKK